MYKLFTIGHSTHIAEKFIELLSMHTINVVCDVRSNPYSKFNPHFNRETIKKQFPNVRLVDDGEVINL